MRLSCMAGESNRHSISMMTCDGGKEKPKLSGVRGMTMGELRTKKRRQATRERLDKAPRPRERGK